MASTHLTPTRSQIQALGGRNSFINHPDVTTQTPRLWRRVVQVFCLRLRNIGVPGAADQYSFVWVLHFSEVLLRWIVSADIIRYREQFSILTFIQRRAITAFFFAENYT
ncbi:hypothetical protein NKR23_g4579 [Pleurostoma richardsiae]|uniref:Uncharacterized protein n=1 Tax=Pleurostoma richardsiae TaxID=41990 RepID=A0AA38RW14_9PEZI|nr:hypothetical protein NKR23_g4579 [Pleurostoma richardsiae]